MVSYTFKWGKPASEVLVTGTFDDWAASVKLDKESDSSFSKTVDLPDDKEKIFYKYVVDGNWVADSTAPSETDDHNNTNNVLSVSSLKAAAAPMSSAAPESSTAAMAAEVPKEADKKEEQQKVDAPGAFPETPATEITEPAKPEGAKTPEDQSYSVNPLPATDGLGNPIKLAPGEPVPTPDEIAAKQKEIASKGEGEGAFSLPPADKTTIPESSLPMSDKDAKDTTDAGPTVQSAAPDSTTAALAGAVPKEPRGVPEVVSESQKEAEVPAEAAAQPEAVAEKKEVERELLGKVETTQDAGEPAPVAAAETAESAPKPTTTSTTEGADVGATPLASREEPLKSSEEEVASAGKKPVEGDLSVPPSGETQKPAEPANGAAKGELNAPAEAPAQTVATEAGQLAGTETQAETGGKKPDEEGKPVATTGTEEGAAPATQTAEPEAPKKTVEGGQEEGEAKKQPSEAGTGSGAEGNGKGDKKHKRRSLFKIIKEKFK
ncbi:hypothetical protein BDY21DRAFT_378416 [Lineolata rhizophorae]|uniref:AMP-activated protein kinase glycogen-binding domain-containing protein n=1 Tax=Lineolata rhizophorae TaxID=578093 RepID=A0A6A6P4A8_9PEZI|nr:hypothetical protein BDY21DRAFT_378416 [Lineolata rhizophorae]